jgi:hypothetical protein
VESDGGAVPRELPCSCQSPLGARDGECLVGEHPINRLREPIHVIRIDEESCVAKYLGERAPVRGDDRYSCGHRFQNRDPEPLVSRRHDEQAGPRINRLTI